MGSSLHGGTCCGNSTIVASDSRSGVSATDRLSWSVHDGKFFADAIHRCEKPRAPMERLWCELDAKGQTMRLMPLERARLRELGIPTRTVEKLGRRNVHILQNASFHGGNIWGTDASNANDALQPPALKDLGGKLIPITEFKMRALLGLGSFSSVHSASWMRTGEVVALKIFFRPVASREHGAGAVGAHLATNDDNEAHVASNDTPWDGSMPRRKIKDPRARPQASYHAHDAASFAMEVALLSKAELEHAHLIRYIGHGFVETEDGPAGYIVTNFLDGRDMYSLLQQYKERRTSMPLSEDSRPLPSVAESDSSCAVARIRTPLPGPLTIARVVRWARHVSSAIAHLHLHGVIHRDIKESNVMITMSGMDAVLIDLGLAVQGRAGGLYKHSHGEFQIGVKGYRAPEINRGLWYGDAVDIFAFGRVLFNMLSIAQPPPRNLSRRAWKAWLIDLIAENACGVCTKRSSQLWAYDTLFCEPLVSQLWPKTLQTLVVQCVACEPSERPSARAVVEQLEQTQGTLASDPSTTSDDARGVA